MCLLTWLVVQSWLVNGISQFLLYGQFSVSVSQCIYKKILLLVVYGIKYASKTRWMLFFWLLNKDSPACGVYWLQIKVYISFSTWNTTQIFFYTQKWEVQITSNQNELWGYFQNIYGADIIEISCRMELSPPSFTSCFLELEFTTKL